MGHHALWMTLGCLALSCTTTTHAQDEPRDADSDSNSNSNSNLAHALQDTFASIARDLAPSVASIAPFVKTDQPTGGETTPGGQWVVPTTDERYPGYLRIGAATGFCIDDKARVFVTARSLLLKPDGTFADLFDVETHDKVHSMAVLVGAEPTLDLAFLKIAVEVDGKTPRMTAITWGDSSAMKPGFWTFAVGDPYGIEQFFAPSVLSATPSRDCYQENLSASYLQTAMSVHPDAYGGPLVDIDGKVIGLLAPRGGSDVIGPPRGSLQFALPSKIIQGIAPSILEKESIASPWLGFAVMSREELREELGPRAFSKIVRPPSGIFIENVFDPSPAFSAGIRPGDFLVALDGHATNTPIDFQKWFYLAGIGNTAELTIYRSGATVHHQVHIDERPPDATNR